MHLVSGETGEHGCDRPDAEAAAHS
jgi:hypothetical protein